jgi:hypothetical protein
MDIDLKKEKEEKKRKEINDNILQRLKAGAPLQDPSNLTWFPPRPIIQKDKDVIKNLYGDDAKIVGDTSHLKVIEEKTEQQEDI